MSIQLCKYKGLAFLSIITLPLLLSLGCWQLRRAEEKRLVLHQQDVRQHQEPGEWLELKDQKDLSYWPVQMHGRFDEQRYFLLDNRVLHSKVGYEVLVPFETDTGDWVILNRGWIQAGRTREQLPKIPMLGNTLIEGNVIGDIYVPPRASSWLSLPPVAETGGDWPLVIQRFDAEFATEVLGKEIFPYQIRLRENQVSALPSGWQVVNVQPEKHIAYAVQWFGMALALMVWYLFANTNLKERLFNSGKSSTPPK